MREVPVAWEALEDAFENNAPEVHSYLHLASGEVIRIVDGIADPGMHERVLTGADYMRIDPVSSREQYRWMERFIATVEDADFRRRLTRAIDGKGAFRRFKDVLMSYPVDRERWFAFRSERLRACMEAWLSAHGIEPVERAQWRVPSAEEIHGVATERTAIRPRRRAGAPTIRATVVKLVQALPEEQLEAALAFVEFLVTRGEGRAADASSTSDGAEPSDSKESDTGA